MRERMGGATGGGAHDRSPRAAARGADAAKCARPDRRARRRALGQPSFVTGVVLGIVGVTGVGCASLPPVRAENSAVVVRAADLAEAEFAARSVERLLPRVRRLLGANGDARVELRIEAGLPHYPRRHGRDVDGYALTDRGVAVLKTRAELGRAWEHMLAHELAHLAMPDGLSDALGFALTEALADVVALQAVDDPAIRAAIEAQWWINVRRGLRVDRPSLFEYRIRDGANTLMLVRGETVGSCVGDCEPVPAERWVDWAEEPTAALWNVAVRGMASLCMQRIVDLHGIDELRGLLTARTNGADPAAWRARWLALAGVGSDPDRWAAELLTRLDADHVGRQIVAMFHEDEAVDPAVLSMCELWFQLDRAMDPDLHFDQWLAFRAPHVVLVEFDVVGDLRTAPAVLDTLRIAWSMGEGLPRVPQSRPARDTASAADAEP